MIPAPDAFVAVLDAINDSGCPYLVTGSIASSAYGEPRGTVDADFVADMNAEDLKQIASRLAAEFERESQLAFETVTGKTQHQFRHRGSKFLIEIFEADMKDPHERARFERRRKEKLLGRDAWFPTAEDVVVQKLRWYGRVRRQKDWDDVRHVLRHQWQRLDWPYIEHWCGEHGTLESLNELRAEAEMRNPDQS